MPDPDESGSQDAVTLTEHGDPVGASSPTPVVDDSVRGRFVRHATAENCLVGVAIVYAIAQLLLLDPARFLEWDEAVYVSRASDRFPAIGWGPQRAPGVPLLLAPPLFLSTSLELLRIWLVVASTVAITLGFGTWLRPVAWAAPIGMGFFCASWTVLFYGSEASPNLFVAACAVGAIGLVARQRDRIGIGSCTALAVATGCAVLLRPSDGVVITMLVGLTSLVHLGVRRSVQPIVAGCAGALLGLVPWAFEARRFGGVVQRWNSAGASVESGLGVRIVDHLKLLDGQLGGVDPAAGLEWLWILVQLAPALLGIASVVVFRPGRTVLPLVAGAGLAAPYLFYVDAVATRFLLPALALTSVAGGIAVTDLSRRFNWFRAAAVCTMSIAAVLGAAKVTSVGESQAQARETFREVGTQIGMLAAGEDCHVVAEFGHPTISIVSGCTGERLPAGNPSCTFATAPGDTVFVASVGVVPGEIEAALTGELIRLPSGWIASRIDPELVECA